MADGQSLSQFAGAVPARAAPTPRPRRAVQVLERYRGTVDRVTGDTAALTLENERGELSAATLGVAQMAGFGLSLTEDFECVVTQQGAEVRVRFRPIPRRPLSPTSSARLQADVDAAYQDFDDDF